MTYGVGIIKFIPMGLKDHFKDFWNFIDVIIVGLSSISVPIWIIIISIHSKYFNNRTTQTDTIDVNEDLKFNEDIKNLVQQFDVYRIGYYLQMYMDLQGILICFVVIKLINCIEKYNSKVGMLFKVIDLV